MNRKQVDGAMVAEVIADQQLMPEATEAPAILPAALQEAEIVPFYRPQPRSGGTKRTWPWDISVAGILIASLLGVLGAAQFRMHRPYQDGYVHATDTAAKSTAPALSSWQVQPVLPAQATRQVTNRNLPGSDAKPLPHIEDPQVLDDSTLRDIRARLIDLRRQLSDLKVSLTPADYRIQRLQSQIGHLEQQSADRRAQISKHFGAQNPEGSPYKQLETQAYSQPQEIVNPATAHANLIQPGQTMRSLGPRATPVLLPAASRVITEAVEPETPTLNAPVELAAPSRPAANSVATPAPEGAVASGSKE
jgi:hypothetical protein